MPKTRSKKTEAHPKSKRTQTPKKTDVKKAGQKKPKKLAPKIVKGTIAPVFDIAGKSQGEILLPKEIFGQKPNDVLLAQAIRVYFDRQRPHKASAKTRAEVRGGGAKPWRQKGTGRARAGSIRSPLWVGGGVVFGPKPKTTKLSLPKKMKRKALISALSSKTSEGAIKVISNFEKLEPKTKLAKNLFNKLGISGKTLVVLENSNDNVKLAARNIPGVSIDIFSNLNAYEVLENKNLLFSKGAVEKFK